MKSFIRDMPQPTDMYQSMQHFWPGPCYICNLLETMRGPLWAVYSPAFMAKEMLQERFENEES